MATCSLVSVGIGLPLVPSFCSAYELVLGGRGAPVEEYNSNIFLTPEPHRSVFGQGFDVDLNAAFKEQRWASEWQGSFANRWYLGERNLDYNNQLFSSKNHFDWSERSRLGMDANYNMDATLTSISDLTASVGYVFQRLSRTVWGFTPYWIYSLNERTRATATYSYQQTNYEKTAAANGRVVDSLSHLGSVDVQHELTEKLSLHAVGVASSYDLLFPRSVTAIPAGTITSGGTGNISTESLSLGFSYNPIESIKVRFSGGVQFNQVENPGQTFQPRRGRREIGHSSRSDSVSEILSAEISKHFERFDLSFKYDKSLSPNLLGTLIATEQYAFAASYPLSSTLSSTLKISLADMSQSGGTQNANSAKASQRTYLNVSAGLSWVLTEPLSLSATYQYSQLDYPFNGQQATGHGAFLRLNYEFDNQHF